MRIVSVVGARPQFVKLAPVAAAAVRAGVEHRVIHTGQHYDQNMSQAFFDELDIAAPDVNLEVGSASHGVQTGRMLAEIEPVLLDVEPDWVLVYGDTNSTLAAAVAATKVHLRVAHLEAGLRSFNRRMPEEHNRVLTDHAADLCLAPSEIAMGHLAAEGLAERAVLVGDVMADVLRQTAERVAGDPVDSPVEASSPYVVATVHRPDNTDDPERLAAILGGLAALDRRVFLAAHPRLVAKAAAHGLSLDEGSITPVPPLSYPQLVQAVRGASAVVTDSGGLQKEAFLLGVPTSTLRAETEWVETLAGGWNELVTDFDAIGASVNRLPPEEPRGHPYGDGHAADATLEVLIERAKEL
ncbi:non-hydrolyzing UDP-N-acetylglucosamine 2-epimerase [Nocardioides pinisoli]|uniref:UDP-N-acetylglucosamine 2-epimerase (Non-hydrolyzing) n=1 Tax=Nocardioides pinisoli TaxID=2950279 RepID=A0ABT1KSD7_9ACTN|nr:UDP-N-acetylglucosamine 2-epimerase (non-hydrolyzing) [Nocardioides pinisoli]MCP3420650.1 UDP-N-acetylglucosamine 2-epimerase (non-hydrolyzing) [Nocardioides pinisoli]